MNSGLTPGGQNLSNRQSGSHEQKNTKILRQSTSASCTVSADSVEETSKYGVLGRYQTCSKERIKVLSDAIERHHPYNTLPAYCIPKAIKMETGEIIYEKMCASPMPPPKISFKDNWMKELGSEVAGHDESSQQTQPKTPNPIVRTGRLVTTELPSRSSVQEIDKRFLLACESANVSVERLDEDKDADENVDADRVRREATPWK